jgi:competence protein ComEC
LVFRLQYKERKFLFTGDIEKTGEEQMLAQGGDLRADVLKVAHHGSRTSTMGPFLENVKPAIALVSSGSNNAFGHPHGDVLKRLAGAGTSVWRTDEQGRISVYSDGRRLRLETYRWPLGRGLE